MDISYSLSWKVASDGATSFKFYTYRGLEYFVVALKIKASKILSRVKVLRSNEIVNIKLNSNIIFHCDKTYPGKEINLNVHKEINSKNSLVMTVNGKDKSIDNKFPLLIGINPRVDITINNTSIVTIYKAFPINMITSETILISFKYKYEDESEYTYNKKIVPPCIPLLNKRKPSIRGLMSPGTEVGPDESSYIFNDLEGDLDNITNKTETYTQNEIVGLIESLFNH